MPRKLVAKLSQLERKLLRSIFASGARRTDVELPSKCYSDLSCTLYRGYVPLKDRLNAAYRYPGARGCTADR